MPGSTPHVQKVASGLMANQREAVIAQRNRLVCGDSHRQGLGKRSGPRGAAHLAGDSQQGRSIWETQKSGLVGFCWEEITNRGNKRLSIADVGG